MKPQNFWQRFKIKEDLSECWEPTHNPPSGKTKTTYTLRRAFELYYRYKPEGFICHKCDNRLCVNPLHLYEGDRSTNSQDEVERNWRVKAGLPRKRLLFQNSFAYVAKVLRLL